MIHNTFSSSNLSVADGVSRLQNLHDYFVSYSRSFNDLSPVVKENILTLMNTCNTYLGCVFNHNYDYAQYRAGVNLINQRISDRVKIEPQLFNQLASRYKHLARSRSYSYDSACHYPGAQIKASIYAIKGRH